MASTAQILIAAIGPLNYDALGERNALLCLAGILAGQSTMASSAQTLINAATAAGFDKLSDRDLKEAMLYAAQTAGPLTAQQCVTGAAAEKYGALSDSDLTKCLLDVMANFSLGANLVPGGATYAVGTGHYVLTGLTVGNVYLFTLGTSGADSGATGPTLTATGFFVATATSITLTGLGSLPVSSAVYAV